MLLCGYGEHEPPCVPRRISLYEDVCERDLLILLEQVKEAIELRILRMIWPWRMSMWKSNNNNE